MILAPLAIQRFYDNNNNPANKGQLFCYVAGTTTKQTSYSDQAGTPNTNPIILNFRGECSLWLDTTKTYKLVYAPADDTDPPTNPFWTQDNIAGGYGGTIDWLQIVYGQTPAEQSASVTPVNFWIVNDWSGRVVPDRFVTNGVGIDMTSAWQQAINVAVQRNEVVEPLGDNYLISDVLSMPDGAQIVGTHRNQYLSGGTKITFSPSSQKNLFVPSGAPAAFRYGYCISGLYIVGNSVNASGNSDICVDAHGWNKSRMDNLAVSGFRTGVQCTATIANNFDFVQLQNCYVQNILYNGGFSTTDVWDKPYIGNSPIAIQTSGTNFAIVFRDAKIEGVTTYGLNLVKESYGFMFEGGYSEDVCTGNLATNAMFRVGYDGAALAGNGTQLIVRGGVWGGRNAGGVGSCLDVDFTDGVIFEPNTVMRFTNGIQTTANTQTNQIISLPFVGVSLSNIVTDITKIMGLYPNGTFNSGTRNAQLMRLLSAYLAGTLTIDSGAAAGTGTQLVIGKGTGTTVGAAGGASALPATPLGYLTYFIGTQQIKIPYYNP
jgi:hypothetical protein